jgi:hypothetical protein
MAPRAKRELGNGSRLTWTARAAASKATSARILRENETWLRGRGRGRKRECHVVEREREREKERMSRG